MPDLTTPEGREELRRLWLALKRDRFTHMEIKIDTGLALLDQADAGEREWRPIETAPKDGTMIAVYSSWVVQGANGGGIGRHDIAHWTNHNGGGWVTLTPGEPVLWAPLPPPPAAATTEDRK